MGEAPETWSEVAARVGGTRFGDVRRFAEVASTNTYLLEEARRGAPEGVVAVADHQTGGRGRMGRRWVAPPGSSLLVSVLLRPDLEAERAHVVTMAAGVAACEAVFLAADFAPSLKWPNDLVVGDRKLAGMLSEIELADDRVDALVVGLGVNVNWGGGAVRDDLPPDLVESAASCDLLAGRTVDREDLLVHLLERLEQWCSTLRGPNGGLAVLDAYRSRCSTLGRAVRVELPGGETVEGVAADVDDAGRLAVELPTGQRRAVAVGDVVHLRPS